MFGLNLPSKTGVLKEFHISLILHGSAFPMSSYVKLIVSAVVHLSMHLLCRHENVEVCPRFSGKGMSRNESQKQSPGWP